MSRAAYGRVTLEDVARAAGVSRATAARAVSGSGLVSDSTRLRVTGIAHEIGYATNALARALATGGGYRVVLGIVGVDVSCLADPYVGRVLAGAAAAAHDDGAGVSLVWVDRDSPAAALRAVADDSSVSGLVLCNTTRPVLDALPASLRARTVSIGVPGPGVPAFDVDNGSSVSALTRYLVDSGRRHIVRISAPSWLPCTRRPEDAFRSTMQAAGLPVRTLPGGFAASDGANAVGELLDRWPDTDAVLASCDATAMGVMSALSAHGVRVPDVVAVAGFDDVPGAALSTPALTTATHPVGEIATAATRAALHHDAEGGSLRYFASELVVRASA